MKRSQFLFIIIIYLINAVNGLMMFKLKNRKRNINENTFNLPKAQFFKQSLNHFDENDKRTWAQRFWVNSNFFNGTGPVFILIGGESAETPYDVVGGAWIEYAQKIGALCVLLEHRFYGRSRPTKDLSVKSLKYLNSSQVLEDIAFFRKHIVTKFQLNDSNKWIAFGGSYAGCLAAWFRLKNPDLVYAAVASSAPMEITLNVSGYYETVRKIVKNYSTKCSNTVHRGFLKTQKLLNTFHGRVYLKHLFKLCNPITSNDDMRMFFYRLAHQFSADVQYNNQLSQYSIVTNCKIMENESISDPVLKLSMLNDLHLKDNNKKCLNTSFNHTIRYYKGKLWNSTAVISGDRQYLWQVCTEFSWFQTSDSSNQLFGNTFSIDFFMKQCTEAFGTEFNLNSIVNTILKTNKNYGGLDYQGSRVIFVNGETDPVKVFGFFKKRPNELTKKIVIKNASHCEDMQPSLPSDSYELTHARHQVFLTLKKWLDE